jgi:hypothetical protein
MTQAFNLAQLANAVDTSGRLNVGTNATGTLPLANGGTGTTNTVNTVVAGTGISVSTSGTQVTVTNTSSASGTVTSVATGNGLQGGTITTSGTLSVACPTYGTVGSYISAFYEGGSPVSGTNYAGGTSTNQIASNSLNASDFNDTRRVNPGGTWKWMGSTTSFPSNWIGLACRVS